jgi:TPR repeat protein
MMLLHGTPGPNGVAAAPQRAVGLLERACDDNATDACYALASQYLKEGNEKAGQIQRDPQKARKLLDKACDLGHGPSCFNLAVMYKRGDDGIAA